MVPAPPLPSVPSPKACSTLGTSEQTENPSSQNIDDSAYLPARGCVAVRRLAQGQAAN